MLFLLTDGTANLSGFTGVDTQFQLQAWLQQATTAVSNAAALLAVVMLVLLIAAAGVYRRHHAAAAPRPPNLTMISAHRGR